jgi:hypothetical protein
MRWRPKAIADRARTLLIELEKEKGKRIRKYDQSEPAFQTTRLSKTN